MATICTCGHENPDGTRFCDQCGAFLAFVASDDAPPTPPAPPEPGPPAPPDAADLSTLPPPLPDPPPAPGPPAADASPLPPPAPTDDPSIPPPSSGRFNLPAPPAASFDPPSGVPEPVAAPPPIAPPPIAPPPSTEPVLAPPPAAAPTPQAEPAAAPPPAFDPSALVDDSTIIRDTPASPPPTPAPQRPSGASVGNQPALTPDRPPPSSSSQPSTAELRPGEQVIEDETRRREREQAKQKEQLVAQVRSGKLKPGDLVCPQCGTGNDPSRSFCKKDAYDLREAPVAPDVKWWRRFWPFSRKNATQQRRTAENPVKHGQSAKKARMGYRKVLSLVGRVRRIGSFAAVLGLGAIFVIPSFRGTASDLANDSIGWVKEITGLEDSEQLKAAAIAADDSQALVADTCGAGLDVLQNAEPPEALVDENAFSFWRSAGLTPTITVTFKDKVDLTDLGVFNGVGTCSTQPYTDARRPQVLELTYLVTEDDGTQRSVGSERLNLKDVGTFESYEVDGNDFDTLEIQVIESFPALGNPTVTEVRLAELEFYGQNEG